MPDDSLVDTVMAETIPELGSDHLTWLLIMDKDTKVERDHTRRRHNYQKGGLASLPQMTQ